MGLWMIDAIGWIGTIFMFGGSIINMYKNWICWPAWVIGGIAIIIQCLYTQSYNLVVLQLLYMPLNVYGWYLWRKDDESKL
jgi:nicotinamide riboside transporter PnuC